MRPAPRRHAWICWGIVAGSWGAVAASRYELGVGTPGRHLRLPGWLFLVGCLAAAALLVASLSRRGRAWMRMRPRLSRPSAHGGTYLEAFALKGALTAVLVSGIAFLPVEWETFAVFAFLGALGLPILAAAVYAFVRARSVRAPLAEWGWRCGPRVLRDLSIGMGAGILMWSFRHLPGAVPGPGVAAWLFVWPDELIVVDIVVWTPILEETLYRGMLYRYLRDRLRWPLAVLVSSAIFAAMHLPPRLTYAFVTALGYALLREWRKSLLAPVAAHASWNLLSIAPTGLLWG